MKGKLTAVVIAFLLLFMTIVSVPAKSVDVGTTPQGYTVDSYDGAAETTFDGTTLNGNITAIHPGDPNGTDTAVISNGSVLENQDSYSIDGWSWNAGIDYANPYISVPTGYASTITTASDIVASIDTDGTLDNSHITEVRNYNNTLQSNDKRYYYDSLAGWVGDDFQIEPHMGIAIDVTNTFTWNINGTDSVKGISFTTGSNATRLHYISVPYTLKDHDGDGTLTSKDLHMSMDDDGSLDDSHISEIRNYDAETRGFTKRYYKGIDGWTGNFTIKPGHGVSVVVEKNFTWTPKLITEPVPMGSSPGVDGLWVERNRTTGNVTLHWNDTGASGGYNIYHSTDRYASWPWPTLDTGVSGTSYTHSDCMFDGDDDYYIVRGTDGGTEIANSSVAFCTEKDLTYFGPGYTGDEKWRDEPEESSDLGSKVYLIGEQEAISTNYTWCTNRSLPKDHNLPSIQEDNTARWEEIRSPTKHSVGVDWINITVEHPKYKASFDSNGTIGGTYDNFDSYAVFIKGGSYTSFTYLGNTKLVGSYKTNPDDYDAPLSPFDWSNKTPNDTDPLNIVTGKDYFNATGLDIDNNSEYAFRVKVNYKVGDSGGYGGGLGTDVYTTYGSGEIVWIDLPKPLSEFSNITIPLMMTMGTLLLAVYVKRKKNN